MNTPGSGKGVCRNRPMRLVSPSVAQRVRQAQQVIIVRPDQIIWPESGASALAKIR